MRCNVSKLTQHRQTTKRFLKIFLVVATATKLISNNMYSSPQKRELSFCLGEVLLSILHVLAAEKCFSLHSLHCHNGGLCLHRCRLPSGHSGRRTMTADSISVNACWCCQNGILHPVARWCYKLGSSVLYNLRLTSNLNPQHDQNY
jgi:hypothetical protein